MAALLRRACNARLNVAPTKTRTSEIENNVVTKNVCIWSWRYSPLIPETRMYENSAPSIRPDALSLIARTHTKRPIGVCSRNPFQHLANFMAHKPLTVARSTVERHRHLELAGSLLLWRFCIAPRELGFSVAHADDQKNKHRRTKPADCGAASARRPPS